MARARDSKGRFVSSGGGSSGSGTNVGSIYAEIGADLSNLEKGIDAALKQLKDFGKQVKDLGKEISLGFSAPLAGISAILTKVGVDFEKYYNSIRVSTGQTGEELQQLEGTFKNAMSSMGGPPEQIAEAVGKLNARLNVTGQPLEDLSKQIVKLSRLTKEDLTSQIAETTRVFGDWSITTEKQSAALDYLFKVHQKTGIEVSKLSEVIVNYGAPLRAFGYSFEQAAIMIGKFAKEGVNTELVLGGFRFALRQFAKEGITDAGKAFAELSEKIKEAKTRTEALAIGQKYFKLANNDMVAAIIENRFNFDELSKSVNNSTETINKAAKDTSTYAGKFSLLTNKIAVALEPLGTKLYDAIEKSFAAMMPYFDEVIKWVSGLIDAFLSSDPAIQTFIAAFVMIGGAVGPVIMGLGALIAALDGIAAPAIAAGFAITTVLSAIASAYAASPELQKAVREIIALFSELAKRLIKTGSEIISGLISGINSMLPSLTSVMTSIANVIISVLKSVLGIASPSKEAIDIGQNVGEGLSEGMDGSEEGVATSAKDLAKVIKDQLQDNLDKVEEFGKAIEQALKKKYEKQGEMAEDKAKAELDAAEKTYNSKKDLLQDETDNVIDNLDKQKQAVKDTADANIREIQKEHREKTKALEDETDALVKNLEAQKENSSQKVEEDTNKQKDTEYSQKLTEKKDKLRKGGSIEELTKTQQEIDNMTADHNLELEKREAKHNEKLLSDQIKTAKEQLKQKKDALDEEQRNSTEKEKDKEKDLTRSIDEQKKAIQENTRERLKQYAEDYSNFKAYEQAKLDTIRDNTKALTDNAGFEAQKILVAGNQQEILTLLQNYYPNWQNAGQKYGEALAYGLNSQKENADTAIANLLNLENVIPQQQAQLDALTKASDGLGNSLGTVSQTTSSFSSSINSITSAIEPITSAFKMVTDAAGTIKGVVDNAGTSCNNFFNGLISAIPGLSGIGEWFQNLSNQYLPMVTQGVNSLTQTVLPILMQMYSYVVDTMFPVISNSIDILFNTVLPPIIEGFQLSITLITDILTKVFNFITVELIPPIMKTFQDMLPTLTEIWNNISIIIGVAMAFIFNAANENLGFLRKVFDEVWPYVAWVVKEGVKAISEHLQSMVTFVNNILKVVSGLLQGDWKKVWEGASSIVLEVLTNLGALVLLPLTSFGTVISNFLTALKTAWDESWGGLQTTVTNVWNGIVGVIDGAIKGINSLIGGLLSDLQGAISWIDQLLAKKDKLLGGGSGNTNVTNNNTNITIDNKTQNTTAQNVVDTVKSFSDSLLSTFGA